MDYIFGSTTRDGVTAETLLTVGDAHSALTGETEIRREFPDGDIVDHFRVTEHHRSGEDGEGRCYDWYTIEGHYRYVDRTPGLAASMESVKAATSVAFVTLAEAGSIDGETAAEHAELFAEWAYPIAYTVGQIRRYQGMLYKCVQAHTSQADWTPDTAASLWSKTNDPAEEWPEWSQPVGAHDAYSKGDKVSHSGKHWTSTADSNVWEPGVYGWTEVTA